MDALGPKAGWEETTEPYRRISCHVRFWLISEVNPLANLRPLAGGIRTLREMDLGEFLPGATQGG